MSNHNVTSIIGFNKLGFAEQDAKL